MRLVCVALLAVALALAGCSAPGPEDDSGAPPPASSPAPSDPATGRAWAESGEAKIRPGVQIVSETGQCTSNFVFEDGLGRVYLGFAAHCVEGLEIGAPLDVANGASPAVLAYSSWATMDAVKEKDVDAREFNDFALALLPAEARGLVSPSMLHFGGPVALADSSQVAMGDKILTYGNSGLRAQLDPAGWHEGYVVETSDWTSTVYTATPGVPGDSGSGVLTREGAALGIVVTLTLLPTAGSNGVTHLDMALAYAREHAGLAVALATAELVDGGVLPG